jgi:hypothetical protein
VGSALLAAAAAFSGLAEREGAGCSARSAGVSCQLLLPSFDAGANRLVVEALAGAVRATVPNTRVRTVRAANKVFMVNSYGFPPVAVLG